MCNALIQKKPKKNPFSSLYSPISDLFFHLQSSMLIILSNSTNLKDLPLKICSCKAEQWSQNHNSQMNLASFHLFTVPLVLLSQISCSFNLRVLRVTIPSFFFVFDLWYKHFHMGCRNHDQLAKIFTKTMWKSNWKMKRLRIRE